MPILAVAGSTSVEERVQALRAGADDCLPSDATEAEVAARLRVWMRRSLGTATPSVTLGPLSYDSHARIAYLDQQPLRLSLRELSLLEALIRRPCNLLSAESLLERLFEWNEEATLNAVQVYISRLRKKIRHPNLRISTVRGLGYYLSTVG